MQELVNRVANSGLLTLKLETLVPITETVSFDIADHLWQGMALREKDFREVVKAYDWAGLSAKRLCVWCSKKAIIPQWAYMLVAASAAPHASTIFVGSPAEADAAAFATAAASLSLELYKDQRVVIKGCTDGREVGPQAYAIITARLRGVAKSIMYGEPCSTVPIWKER